MTFYLFTIFISRPFIHSLALPLITPSLFSLCCVLRYYANYCYTLSIIVSIHFYVSLPVLAAAPDKPTPFSFLIFQFPGDLYYPSQHFLLYISRILRKTHELLDSKVPILLLYTYLTVFPFSNFYFSIGTIVSCFMYKPQPFPYLLVAFLFFYKNLVLAAAPDRHSHYFLHIIPFQFSYVSYSFLYVLLSINLLTLIIYTPPIFLVSIIVFITILFLQLLTPLSTGASILNFHTSNIFFFNARLFFASFFGYPHVLPFI